MSRRLPFLRRGQHLLRAEPGSWGHPASGGRLFPSEERRGAGPGGWVAGGREAVRCAAGRGEHAERLSREGAWPGGFRGFRGLRSRDRACARGRQHGADFQSSRGSLALERSGSSGDAVCGPSSKAKVIILNAEATALDELADVVLRGSISQILPQLVGLASML